EKRAHTYRIFHEKHQEFQIKLVSSVEAVDGAVDKMMSYIRETSQPLIEKEQRDQKKFENEARKLSLMHKSHKKAISKAGLNLLKRDGVVKWRKGMCVLDDMRDEFAKEPYFKTLKAYLVSEV